MIEESRIVDAIDDGKIVRVSEDYARREGLLILRKSKFEELENKPASWSEKYNKPTRNEDFISLDSLRRPLKRNENNVAKSLIDNFQWHIRDKRRRLNLTRKQVASAIGAKELDLKMLENGIVPSDDFILINKVQEYMGINLRNDGQNFNIVMRDVVESKKASQNAQGSLNKINDAKQRLSSEDSTGEDIEIIDE